MPDMKAQTQSDHLADNSLECPHCHQFIEENSLRWIEPDIALELFSRPKLQERQKATQNLARIDKAINAAILQADYEGVKKIAE